MKRFSVNKKTGFCTNDSPRIYCGANLFYFHENKTGGKFYFNLPKGEYLTESEIIKLNEPVIVPLPKLPPREVFYRKPKKIELVIKPNKNKCSIDLRKNIIYLDPEMVNKGRSVLNFILFHEIGHYFYKSEEKCDLFAAKEMLKRGFNPSQCGFSINSALSNFSTGRKLCLIKNLK